MSALNFKLGPSSKVFLFSETFRVVYYTLDPCMHTQTQAYTSTHMYPSPVGFLVALRHVSSGYIFVITIILVVVADSDVVVVRACQIISKFALQIPLLPLLWPVLWLLLLLLLICLLERLGPFARVVHGISKQKHNNRTATAAINQLSSLNMMRTMASSYTKQNRFYKILAKPTKHSFQSSSNNNNHSHIQIEKNHLSGVQIHADPPTATVCNGQWTHAYRSILV